MPQDTRQKYDATIILKAGQAINVTTFMPPEEVEREVLSYDESTPFARLEGMTHSGEKTLVCVDRREVVGLLVIKHVVEPQIAPGRMGPNRVPLQ